MDIRLLVNLCSRRWSLKILALLHDGVPGRQAQLITASGAGRTAFVQSLKHVETLGLIERNPGHGHPFRPEFVLTEEGVVAAALASRIINLPLAPLESVLIGRTWTLPILRVIGQGAYYRELSARLEPITDRALSQSLKSMELQKWVARQVDAQVRPPRVHYAPMGGGALIARQFSVDAAGREALG